jgi:DNA-binding transcriptional LysR family regulator
LNGVAGWEKMAFGFRKYRTMLKLENIQALTAIAEGGSLTAAARRLGVSKSVISDRLSDIERALGSKLIHRTTRKLALTDDGRIFYERAKAILSDVENAAAELSARRGLLSGPLRISAPVGFGCLHLGPALFGFLNAHPGIELTLDLDDRFVNMVAEGFDAVIRHGPVDDKRIIVKRLATTRRVLVAAPEYLRRFGTPKSLADLEQHRGVLYSYRGAGDWRFRAGRKFVTVQPQVALRVNNGILMRDAAAAGLGIALLPDFFLTRPDLLIVDVGAEAEGAVIHIAYPEHLRSAAKIRSLTAWLQKSFSAAAFANTQRAPAARLRS